MGERQSIERLISALQKVIKLPMMQASNAGPPWEEEAQALDTLIPSSSQAAQSPCLGLRPALHPRTFAFSRR